MRCYYEVLGVANDVSDDDLRKAYRRLALLLHPDKNPDNQEEAKTKFQEIQSAYEVLSDPQERAFYDRNRENILRGEESGSGQKGADIHLFKYFRASCFSGFDDSEKGFYTVYRNVFDTIAKEDLRYLDDTAKIPNFGRSDAVLEDVADFYGYWQSYCTSQSFYWEDQYDIREAQNRWVEKKIEKENKKLRDKAKKEFNEEVRSLVAFVKKRDKRYSAWKKQLEEKVAENARKQQEQQRKQREERKKWMQETFEEQKESLSQYERQLKEMESQFAEEWGMSSDSESDEDAEENVEALVEGLYCIACEKNFKSDKAFKNHEQSKKHKENQAALAAFMKDEEDIFSSQNDIEEPSDTKSAEEEIVVSSSRKKKKKQKQSASVPELEKSASKTRRKNRQSLDNPIESDEREDKHRVLERVTCDGDRVDDQIDSNDLPKITPERSESPEHVRLNGIEETKSQSPNEVKPPKLKGKKAKETKKKTEEAKVDHVCTTCNGRFTSKNKLFTHLKEAGHAALKTENRKVKSKR